MIDNTMIIQDFRRELKKPEMWKRFSEDSIRSGRKKNCRCSTSKYHVENEIALRKLLESHGDSLDDMKEAFLLEDDGPRA